MKTTRTVSVTIYWYSVKRVEISRLKWIQWFIFID